MSSVIRVNTITNRSGLSTVSFSDTGVVISGVTTISDLRTTDGALTVGTGASIFSPTTNILSLGTNNAERVRVSNGGVSIGTITTYGDSNSSFASLSLGGNGTRYGLLEIKQSNGVAGAWVDCYGTGGNGDLRITTAGTSGAITFLTGGAFTEKVRIDSSGNLGINSTSPARKLDVVDSGASGSVIRSRVTTNNGGYLAYEALNSSGTSVFSVTHNGRINLSENIVFASGQGIDFSATANSSGTMTSELLSDYEEGTWDCRPTTSTSSIVLPSGISSLSFNGTYVKIGSMVYLTGYFETSQTSADTSIVYLRLPFAVNGTSSMWSSTGTETSLWSFPSGVTYITVRPESGQSYASFKGCGTGIIRVDMTANRIFASSGMYWIGMMMYRTA